METLCTRQFCQDLQGLFSFASEYLDQAPPNNVCFSLRRFGQPVFNEDSVLVRVEILEQCDIELEIRTSPLVRRTGS